MDSTSPSESVKSLRFLHQLLMLVSAGILILALTPNPSHDYNAALDELTALKKITGQGHDYGVYLAKFAPPSAHGGALLLADLLHDVGARSPKQIEFPTVFASDWMFLKNTVTDYDEFFSSDAHKIVPLEPHFDKTFMGQWVAFIKQQIAAQDQSDASPVFQGVKILLGQQVGDGIFIQQLSDIPPDQKIRTSINLVFTGARNANMEMQTPITVTFSLGKEQTGHFALDWLESTTVGRELVDAKSRAVLPKLKRLPFWNRLRLMDFDNAASYLREKLDSIDAETISFFGLAVRKNVAIWAGPLACLSISWFFFAHLRRFSAAGATETALDFPWVGLFPGWPNAATTYVSLSVLPAVANLWLILTYGNVSDRSTRIGAVFTLLLALLAARIALDIRTFRRQLAHEKVAPPLPPSQPSEPEVVD